MTSWDRRGPARSAVETARALRRQVGEVVGPHSPFWRTRLAALGRTPAQVASLAGLRTLPAVGEHDLCPTGDPADAAALVVQLDEQQWALTSQGPELRRGLLRRWVAPASYRAQVESDTRATSYTWEGLATRFPVASTRSDLDVLARAGARTWHLLGLTRADVLVGALPAAPSAVRQLLELAATGAAAPAVLPDPDDLVATLQLVPATVLAVAADDADAVLRELEDLLDSLRVVLVLGAPTAQERASVAATLQAQGRPHVRVLALHVPAGDRLPWVQCADSASDPAPAGLHVLGDLELVGLVDPDTGADLEQGPGEPVLTHLALRGTALLRWRTGDLADAVTSTPCPSCGRTTPRVIGLRRAALVPEVLVDGGLRPVDLRAVTAALAGLGGLGDWWLQLGTRTSPADLLVHVRPAPGADEGALALEVAETVRRATGHWPTQVVLGTGAPPEGPALTRRIRLGQRSRRVRD